MTVDTRLCDSRLAAAYVGGESAAAYTDREEWDDVAASPHEGCQAALDDDEVTQDEHGGET